MADASDPLAVVRALLDAINRGDQAGFGTLLNEDVVQKEPATGAVFTGPHDVTHNMWSYINSFPDLKIELVDGFASGDKLAAELRFQGTYEPYTYGPQARTISWQGCVIGSIRTGRLAKLDFYTDWMSVLDQLEVLPSAPPSPPPGYISQHLANIVQRGAR